MRRSRNGLVAAVALAALALIAPAAAAAPAGAPAEPVPDLVKQVWQQGRLVTVAAVLPGPGGPRLEPARPGYAVDVPLIGVVDPAAPQDPGGVRCPPPGVPAPCIYLPAHDDVLPPQLRGFATRALTYGQWVVPSADAPPGAVLTRDVRPPADLDPSVAQPFGQVTELAYAIRVGRSYRPLTSTHWVDWGVRRGWLELDDSVGLGGTAWVLDAPRR